MRNKLFNRILLTLTAIVVVITAAACDGSSSLGGFIQLGKYENASNYAVGNAEYSATGITSVSVHWSVGQVKIVRSGDDRIYLTESGDGALPEAKRIRSLVIGEKLDIRFWASELKDTVDEIDKFLTLSIPENLTLFVETSAAEIRFDDEFDLTTVDVKTSSGKICANAIKTNSFSATSSSGDINIVTLTADATSITTSSGNATISSLSAGSLRTVTSSGNTAIGLVGLTTGNATSSSGKITLSAPSGLGLTVIFSSSSGKLTYDSKTYLGGKFDFNGGGAVLNVNTSSGNLIVNP